MGPTFPIKFQASISVVNLLSAQDSAGEGEDGSSEGGRASNHTRPYWGADDEVRLAVCGCSQRDECAVVVLELQY